MVKAVYRNNGDDGSCSGCCAANCIYAYMYCILYIGTYIKCTHHGKTIKTNATATMLSQCVFCYMQFESKESENKIYK